MVITRVLVLGSALAWFVPSVEAQACSCGQSCELVAPRSETHPASGGVLLTASCGSPIPIERYQVTVDGIEASLVADEEVWAFETSQHLLAYALARVQPPAMPAQEVVVTMCGLNDCAQGCAEGSPQTEVARYQVTEPDDVPPSLEGTVTLNHAENFFYPFCSEDDLEFVTAVTISDHDEEEGMILRAHLRTAEGALVRTSLRYVEEPTDLVLMSFYVSSTELEVQPHELCVDVAALDLSGNESHVASACGSTPRAEEDPADGTTGGDESTSTEVTAGDHASSTGVDAEPGHEPSGGPLDRGCSCSATPMHSPLSWVAVLLVASIRRRASSSLDSPTS